MKTRVFEAFETVGWGAATASTLGMGARRPDTGLTLAVFRGLGV